MLPSRGSLLCPLFQTVPLPSMGAKCHLLIFNKIVFFLIDLWEDLYMLDIFLQFVACIHMLWWLFIKMISVLMELNYQSFLFKVSIFYVCFEKAFSISRSQWDFPIFSSNGLKFGFSHLMLKSKRFLCMVWVVDFCIWWYLGAVFFCSF